MNNGKLNSLLENKDGTPGATRTHYLRFRKPALYPGELRGQSIKIVTVIFKCNSFTPKSNRNCGFAYTILRVVSYDVALYHIFDIFGNIDRMVGQPF